MNSSDYLAKSLEKPYYEKLLMFFDIYPEVERSLYGVIEKLREAPDMDKDEVIKDLQKEIVMLKNSIFSLNQKIAYNEKTKGSKVNKPISFSSAEHSIIEKVVCEYYGVTPAIIYLKTRKRELCLARQIIMFLCRKMTKLTQYEIGCLTAGLDHATVLYAEKTISNLIDTDPKIRCQIVEIIEIIRSFIGDPDLEKFIPSLSFE